MSISADRFESNGHFPTYDPFRGAASKVMIFQLQCRCCGFEPEDVVTPPRVWLAIQSARTGASR